MSIITEDLKREIGQHFVFGFHGHELTDDVKALIRDYHVGSIILMKRNVRDVQQVKRVVEELQLLARESGHPRPLLVGIDQENGLVSAFSSSAAGTQFPGAMALAATASTELAEQISTATAHELKLAGINWAYSPVADVNSDSRNPVIGVRSFGDDPEDVGKYANAVSRGLTAAGVAPSAKHFPGHGDTHVDSHLALPRINKTKAELFQTELIPFKALIQGNVATIMTGHMALPLVTGNDTPCSLSRLITTDLLRNELKFGGVVVTDCLEMDAVAEPAQGGCGVEEGAVRALAAGADIVMICHTMEKQRGAVERVYEAFAEGRLNEVELREGGKRIEALKEAFAGQWGDVLGQEDGGKFERRWRELKIASMRLSEKAYANSVTLIQDKKGVLPLKVGGKVLLFTPEKQSLNKAVDDAEGVLRTAEGRVRNTAGASYLALASSVGKRAACTHMVYTPRDEDIDKALDAGVDALVFVLRNADQAVWQTEYLKKVLTLAGDGVSVVIVSSCAPYDLVGVDGVDGAGYVGTFEFTPEAFEACTRVVFGEDEARGRVPVLDGYVL